MAKQKQEPKYDYLPSGDYDIYYYYGTDVGFMVCYLFLKLREAAWAGNPLVSERGQIRLSQRTMADETPFTARTLNRLLTRIEKTGVWGRMDPVDTKVEVQY
jgi:hypothetical protein